MIKFKTLSAFVILGSLTFAAKADPACWPQQAEGTGTAMVVGQDDKNHWVTWYCPVANGWTPVSMVNIEPPSASLQKTGPELIKHLKVVEMKSGNLNPVFMNPLLVKANIQLEKTKPR